MIHLPPPCRRCKSSDVKHTQYEESQVQWFICRLCGHVWCATNPQPSDVLSHGMAALAWRRHHGHDIVAAVTIDGRGLWSVATSRQSNPTVIIRTAKLQSWDAACAKADALARRAFAHSCQATCGDWLAVVNDVRDESERLCGDVVAEARRPDRRSGPRVPRDHAS
jgi:hypothetical protein